MLSNETISQITERGVSNIISKSEFVELLNSGKTLRLKMGFDPSRPDIHLGHVVGLRKLRQLQELGHQVILIVGDWTAQIGDPSGRSATRQMLSHEEVIANAESYMRQFFKVIDHDRTQVMWQSEWFGKFTLADVISLTGKFTVAQFLERDDFSKRFQEHRPIAITELLYPLLQAYDSVAIESDVEFGGTDQMFNLLVGRELQGMLGYNRQQCFMMPILVGTDGTQKMSKSLDNYIGIEEPPNDIYGKVMSIPDTLIVPYFEWLTDVPTPELNEIKTDLDSGSANAMELKKRVAGIIVEEYHNTKSASSAREFFERTVQGREIPDDIPIYALPPQVITNTLRLSNLLQENGMTSSAGEARRLIDQGAVRLDDKTITQNVLVSELKPGVLRVGRRRYLRLV